MTPLEEAMRREVLRTQAAPKAKAGYRKMRVPTAIAGVVPGVGKDDGEIVIDINASGAGASASGFVPKIVATHGKGALMRAIREGREWVEAMVAERVVHHVLADHQMSSSELHDAVARALAARYPRKKGVGQIYQSSRAYVRELYPLENYVIFELSADDPTDRKKAELCKQRYKVIGRTVKLIGKPIPVSHRYVEEGQKIVQAGATLRTVMIQMSQSPATQAPGAGSGPLLNRDRSGANGIGTRLQPLPGIGRTGKDWGASGSDLSRAQPTSKAWERATFGARNSELRQKAQGKR